MRACREAVGPGVPLYAAANGNWSLEDTLRFVRLIGLADFILEQPCWSLAENIAVARAFGGPLVLDEGVTSLADLLAAYQAGILSGVTIKMARVGGIGPTRLIRDLAQKLGLSVTIENTGGSTLNMSATAQIMCSTPASHQAHTVDFMNWVTVQNATDMPQARDGQLWMPPGIGLGV